MIPAYLKSLSDQERHDYILETFVLNRSAASKHKRDIDVIKEHHKFLWTDETASTWESQLARRYYDKLFREYCIADLTRHRENKVALRWRIEAEVVSGKGQFQCGSRRCEMREGLRTWEVNFAYQEHGERKNALVKVRLCPAHSAQLNFTSCKREVKRLKRMGRREAKEKKRRHRLKDTSLKISAEEAEEAAPSDKSTKKSEPSSSDNEVDDAPRDNEKVVAEAAPDVDDAWSRKLDIELEPTSRETEFERYLEDLLL